MEIVEQTCLQQNFANLLILWTCCSSPLEILGFLCQCRSWVDLKYQNPPQINGFLIGIRVPSIKRETNAEDTAIRCFESVVPQQNHAFQLIKPCLKLKTAPMLFKYMPLTTLLCHTSVRCLSSAAPCGLGQTF